MAYSKESLECFLKNQRKLFDEDVASNLQEAAEFLEECMAVEVKNLKEVREYLEELGMDTAGVSNKELEEEAEVFKLPSGKFLIVEG